MSATSHVSGRRTLQAVSLCLGYPDESLLVTVPLLRTPHVARLLTGPSSRTVPRSGG